MQTGAVLAGLRLSCQICPSRNSSLSNPSRPFNPSPPLPLKFHKQFSLASQNVLEVTSPLSETTELADIDWDNLGFNIQPTDYMYIMKCQQGGTFSKGEIKRYGNIEFSPSAGVLSYGQGLFEGLKAYRKQDGNILLFRPEENAEQMKAGAERMCMASPTTEQFLQAVKDTVLANKRWIPPAGKGSLYIKPLLIGSGAVLGVAPAPE